MSELPKRITVFRLNPSSPLSVLDFAWCPMAGSEWATYERIDDPDSPNTHRTLETPEHVQKGAIVSKGTSQDPKDSA